MLEKETKVLYKTYPELYKQKDLSMDKSCMFWGFECGSGWYKIIDKLSNKLVRYSRKKKIDLQATQVKEKYASLAFYTNFSDDAIDKMIDGATVASLKTCEACGSTKGVKQRGAGWISTLCNKCWADFEKEQANANNNNRIV
jgi:hypothetical protein